MTSKLPIGWMCLFPLTFLAGCSLSKPPVVAMEKFEVRLAQSEQEEGLQEQTAPESGAKIYVHPGVVITNSDIDDASYVQDERGLPAVAIRFKKSSQKHIAKFSSGNIGKIAAIYVNGRLLSAPVIRSEFSEAAQITGHFKVEEAQHIARAITAD